MRHSVEVFLVALTVITTALTLGSQSAAVAQSMQAGISVELPFTNHAEPMPAADRENSVIVSVTDKGKFYIGVSPIAIADLAESLKSALFSETGKVVYIKADARAAYASLEKVLDAARVTGVATPVLLTVQQALSNATPVPPQGLEVQVGLTIPSSAERIVVQVPDPGLPSTLKINDRNIPWDAIRKMPFQFFPRGQVVSVTADALVPVARVVEVIDACHSTGAEVLLATPQT